MKNSERLVALFPLVAALCAGLTGVAAGAVPPELQQRSRSYIKSGKSADRTPLAAYVEKAGGAQAALARFALGMGDYEAGAYEAAIPHLRNASREGGVLADYAHFFAARALAGEEKFAAAAEVIESFPRRFPESLLLARVIRLQAESLIREKRWAEARTLLNDSRSKVEEPVRLYLIARTLELDGQLLNAVRSYRLVYYKHPTSAQVDDAEAALNTLRRRLGNKYPDAPAKWRLERADKLFDARKYSKAAPEYHRALDGLKGRDLERAQVRAGAADYRRLRTTIACGWLLKLKISDPKWAAERLYYLGECARRKRKITEFRQRAEELGKKFPKSPWYGEALFSLGNYYLLENKPAEYRRYYERCARAVPRGVNAAKAHWKVCWRAYRERDPRAAALFEEHVRVYPKSSTASGAIYWLARLKERDGQTSFARALYTELMRRYPHYYHAVKARERIGKLKASSEQAAVPSYFDAIPGCRRFADQPSDTARIKLERGRLLFDLGLGDLAEGELRTADYRKPDAHWVGLELARQKSEGHQYHRGLRYMKRYGFGYLRVPFDTMPREYWERLFPLPYSKQLKRRAAPHKLDPYLVAGLIRQESEFNATAKSRAGALGLMQLMPATGRGLARQLGIGGISNRQLYNPDLSLRLGTFHFKKVLERFQHRLEYTLAGYNAGEHRVDKWRTWEDFSDPEEFAESIPFTETRGYVQAVIRNAAVYRLIYSGT
jgi:soluble lytic murein transglycosylase